MRIVTKDEIYSSLADKYVTVGDNLQSIVDRYTEILHSIAANGIMEGETAQGIEAFAAAAQEKLLDTNKAILHDLSAGTVGYTEDAAYADRYTDIDGVTHQSNA